MTMTEVLAVTHKSGIRLEARGTALHVEAPAGTMTPELRAALAAHKPELLARLAPVEFVTLKGGLTVPRPALDQIWSLEARGIVLATDGDHQFIVPTDVRLTDEDLVAIQRWKLHLGPIVEYRAPDV
jgi:hypothetical protein